MTRTANPCSALNKETSGRQWIDLFQQQADPALNEAEPIRLWGGNHQREIPARSLCRRLVVLGFTSKSIRHEERGLTILVLTSREGGAVNKRERGHWSATDQLVFCFVSFHKVKGKKRAWPFLVLIGSSAMCSPFWWRISRGSGLFSLEE